MNKVQRQEQEKKAVASMIQIYCYKNHHHSKHGLCDECTNLRDYAFQRIERCPFMETKSFCSNCKVHCYQQEMREQIRKVMRFSGPRMLLHDPIMAIRHVLADRKEKKHL